MALRLLGFRHGQRVRDNRTGSTGTVRIIRLDPVEAADCGYALLGEVRWDTSFVHEQLDLVARHLTAL
ncbi:MAG: hypothetical protein JO285_09435 [Kutzneria sp.]|nr:hypothetical protein [Kutzneria sp.]